MHGVLAPRYRGTAMTDKALPTGTVTFLMSDIEGSTRLLQEVGDAYHELLVEHYAILDRACSAAGGAKVSTEGDSMFFAFGDASSAIVAAVSAQRALAEHRSRARTPVRVRVGIHSGEGRLLGSTYVGLDVHRVARITAAAHGGQVVVSDSTRALVAGRLPRGLELRDLRLHRLKDLDTPEHLFQLAGENLALEFPPLRSLPDLADRLPPQLTSFVGRERERDEIAALVRAARIVTLTGPGGTGKTRLSLEVGALLGPEFADGVQFVALAAITDPGLLVPTIAQTLGLREGSRQVDEVLRDHLLERSMLIVLDNFEQLMAAAGSVAALAALAPRVSWLVTSRELLRVSGERAYPVPPLAIPTLSNQPDLAELAETEAVALFVQRARAVRPNFALTMENASAVVEICAQLDGLPLAIELAAARMNLFEPAEIISRLDQRLSFLTGGRDADARQRTLRGAIDWSYDLLTPAEQALFRRVSVFSGGCTLAAAQAVCLPQELGANGVDEISSLFDKNLLRRDDSGGDELRLVMLETVREYGLERLRAAGEAAELRRRHFEHFVERAEGALARMNAPDQQRMLEALERDLDNFRAAIRWTIEQQHIEMGVRLVSALEMFWVFRDHLSEGRHVVTELLKVPNADVSLAVRAALLGVSASLATWQADYVDVVDHAQQSLAAYRQLADESGIANQLTSLGWGLATTEPGRARAVFEEAIARHRALGAPPGVGQSLIGLAVLEMQARDIAAAAQHTEEAEQVFRDSGDENMALIAAGVHAICFRLAGDLATAQREYLDVLQRAEAVGASIALTLPLQSLADLALLHGDPDRAAVLDAAQARLGERIGGTPGFALMGISSVADRARADLGEERYAAATERGRALEFDEVMRLARA